MFFFHAFLPSITMFDLVTTASWDAHTSRKPSLTPNTSNPGLVRYPYLLPQHHVHIVIIEVTTMSDKSLYMSIYPKWPPDPRGKTLLFSKLYHYLLVQNWVYSKWSVKSLLRRNVKECVNALPHKLSSGIWIKPSSIYICWRFINFKHIILIAKHCS